MITVNKIRTMTDPETIEKRYGVSRSYARKIVRGHLPKKRQKERDVKIVDDMIFELQSLGLELTHQH